MSPNDTYEGEERRIGERRQDFCSACSGIIRGLEDLCKKQEGTCADLSKTKESFALDNKEMVHRLDGKVPMRLFYVMVALVISILAFQWTTYERIGFIALSHEKAVGNIQLSIKEIQTAIAGHQKLNQLEVIQLKNAVQNHQAQTDRDMDRMNESLQEVKKAIKTNGQ